MTITAQPKTIAELIELQNKSIKSSDSIDFALIKGKDISFSARSTCLFGEELLYELRSSTGYIQAQALLSLLKSAHNRDDFNYLYYCLKPKSGLKINISRLSEDRYVISIASNVDDWCDDWFIYFNEQGLQFDPQANKEFKKFE